MQTATQHILRSLRMQSLLIMVILIALAATPSLALLGDSTADLVYTPITPCRVLDTRIATIPAADRSHCARRND